MSNYVKQTIDALQKYSKDNKITLEELYTKAQETEYTGQVTLGGNAIHLSKDARIKYILNAIKEDTGSSTAKDGFYQKPTVEFTKLDICSEELQKTDSFCPLDTNRASCSTDLLKLMTDECMTSDSTIYNVCQVSVIDNNTGATYIGWNQLNSQSATCDKSSFINASVMYYDTQTGNQVSETSIAGDISDAIASQ